MATQAAADGGDAAPALPPRLLLDELSSYSPNSNPFGDRPTARTPQGIQVLAAAGRKSEADADWLLRAAAGDPASGSVTPRLTASWDLPSSTTKLSGRKTPGDSASRMQATRAAKWLQSMSPASKAAAAAAAVVVAGAKASPAHPAAAAAAIALGAAGSSDSPRALDGGTSPPAPSPASMFPRSHPIVRKSLTVQAPTPSGGGLASWLRLSSHLSKPAEEELEASLSPEDSGSAEDSPSQPRSQLDFGAVAVQAQPLPSPTAAPQAAVQAEPEPPSPVPAGTDAAGGAASPTAATSVSPKPAAAGCPIPAAAAGSSAPAALQPARRRQTRSSTGRLCV